MMDQLLAHDDPKKALLMQLLKQFRGVEGLEDSDLLEGQSPDLEGDTTTEDLLTDSNADSVKEAMDPGRKEVALDEYTDANRPVAGEDVDLRDEMKKFFGQSRPAAGADKKSLRMGMETASEELGRKPLIKKKTVSIA